MITGGGSDGDVKGDGSGCGSDRRNSIAGVNGVANGVGCSHWHCCGGCTDVVKGNGDGFRDVVICDEMNEQSPGLSGDVMK